MISEMNSTALAAIMEVVGFALIHLVNLSTSTKICVNPSLAFLNGPTRSSPHEDVFLTSKKLAPVSMMNQGVGV
jgi:hypothetical protein